MKPLLLTLTLLIFAGSLQAQEVPRPTNTEAWETFKAKEGDNWQIRWNVNSDIPRTLVGTSKTKFTGTPEMAAKSFLLQNRELFPFKKELIDLRHKNTKTNRNVSHVTFQQHVNEIKVEGAEYKIHIRNDGTIDMVNGYYYNNINISTKPTISKSGAIQIAMSDLKLPSTIPNQNTTELVIYPHNGQFELSYKVEVFVEEPFTNWQYFVNAENGDIIKAYNLTMTVHTTTRTSSDNDNIESLNNRLVFRNDAFVIGTGNVYPKHPGNSSVTSKSLYGLDGNGKLDGTYVRAKNSSSSDAYSGSHNFSYNISNTHFDETNLYYHVDNFRRNFIENLDSGNNLFNFIEAYAHNNSVCPNNACFNPNTGDIYFSDGYDFAKEDKIIHHEYSHKVVRDIESGIYSSVNGEEGSISEGIPDYFAGSFTGRAKIIDYALPSAERNMNDPVYSDYGDLPTNIYGNVIVSAHIGGEFFSSILWNIRNNSKISASQADYLVFDALYRISGNPDFIEFRDAMMAADDAAYNGEHKYMIQDMFADKGVGNHSPLYYDISGPVLMDEGTSETWSFNFDSNNYGTPPFTYKWYRNIDGQGTTLVSTNSTYGGGQYHTFSLDLIVEDANGKTGFAEYYVVVDDGSGCIICKSVNLPKEFSLNQNYPNPFNPSTQIKYALPEQADVSIRVYNIMGQQVATLVNASMGAGFHEVNFDAGNLASGVYLTRMEAIGQSGEQFSEELKMQLIK